MFCCFSGQESAGKLHEEVRFKEVKIDLAKKSPATPWDSSSSTHFASRTSLSEI